MARVTGPRAPMTTEKKKAGRSRAAQRQYLRGVDQKRGVVADMVVDGASLCVSWLGWSEACLLFLGQEGCVSGAVSEPAGLDMRCLRGGWDVCRR